MPTADRNHGDRLNDALDALVRSGDAARPDLDPAARELAERFFAVDDAPPPPDRLASQIWEDLMGQTAPSPSIPRRSPFVGPATHNGSAPTETWWPGRFPAAGSPRWWRGGFARFAAAAILLVTLGLGYRAVDPLGGGSDRQVSIPAVVVQDATPDASASPPATEAFPTEAHPLVGAWQWQWQPWTGPSDADFALFLDNGLVVLAGEDSDDVSIGAWRATGARTAELVRVQQRAVPLDFMFDPDFVPPQSVFEGNMLTGWMAIEVAPDGNALSATGYYEPRDASGAVIVHLEHDEVDGMQLTATRLDVAPQDLDGTPEP